jgi:hypothetical protein
MSVSLSMLILPLRGGAGNREGCSVGRKRTEIIIETERILIINRRSTSSILWCERCGTPLPMLTLEEAALVMRVSVGEVLRRIEDQRLHCVRLPGATLRICPNSLMK